MAKKKEAEPKVVLERVYNVPLRREFMKAPNWNRSKKAVKALKEFIVKHMKSENVLIGKYVNQQIWKDGIKNPPHHIKVNAIKDDKGTVKVELVELPKSAERKLKKEKEAELKAKDEKEKKKPEEKPKEEKKEEKIEDKLGVEEKTDQKKAEEKEKLKELKKELPKQEAPKSMPQPKQSPQVRPTAPKSQ